jgi:hypothetical protein
MDDFVVCEINFDDYRLVRHLLRFVLPKAKAGVGSTRGKEGYTEGQGRVDPGKREEKCRKMAHLTDIHPAQEWSAEESSESNFGT